MEQVEAITVAILDSDGRSFGPLVAAYDAAGLWLPRLWLSPTADDIELDQQRDLLAWWRARTGAGLPGLTQLDPLALRPYLGDLTVLEPTGDGDYVYRVHGTNISYATGYELTGRRVSQGPRDGSLPQPLLWYFQAVCRVAERRAAPLYAQHHWQESPERMVCWHRLMLPFGDRGRPQRLLVSNIPVVVADDEVA